MKREARETERTNPPRRRTKRTTNPPLETPGMPTGAKRAEKAPTEEATLAGLRRTREATRRRRTIRAAS